MLSAPTTEVERLTLYNMSWEGYETLLALLGERPIRTTYNQGVVELIILSYKHERYKKLLARFVETLTEELDMPIAGGGSTTFRRRDLERGLEPDECFYIVHESAVRGKLALDLTVDPPPDLAIEIDVANSSVDRMSIYAALGVSEVWRFDGTELSFWVREGKTYQGVGQSLAFPQIQPSDLLQAMTLSATADDTTVIRSFRRWLRQRLEA